MFTSHTVIIPYEEPVITSISVATTLSHYYSKSIKYNISYRSYYLIYHQ